MTRDTPILFQPPMVRAILDGRKTQTRRLVKPQPEKRLVVGVGPLLTFAQRGSTNRWLYPNARDQIIASCPYGRPGDRLWVKETWRPSISHGCAGNTCDCADVNVTYAADGAVDDFPDRAIPDAWTMPKAAARGNVSPLFMPKWASRIWLELKDVRLQRLQDIEAQDAAAEGLHQLPATGRYVINPGDQYFGSASTNPREVFEWLWEAINGPDSWGANPWVWALTFKRVNPPKFQTGSIPEGQGTCRDVA